MQNSEGSSSKVNRLPNISIPALHPRSSLEQITPTTSAFQTGSASSSPQYQTSPAHSATAAALASATVRSNLKIGRVRVVESTHGGIVPAEHVESQEALPAQFQKTLPLQAMQGEEGFATGNSVQSSVTNSIYDASKTSPQSAIQGNIEDEDEDDDYGRDDDIKDEDYGKSSHPYGKGPFGTVHTLPYLVLVQELDPQQLQTMDLHLQLILLLLSMRPLIAIHHLLMFMSTIPIPTV